MSAMLSFNKLLPENFLYKKNFFIFIFSYSGKYEWNIRICFEAQPKMKKKEKKANFILFESLKFEGD